jgi:hypothetical protein
VGEIASVGAGGQIIRRLYVSSQQSRPGSVRCTERRVASVQKSDNYEVASLVVEAGSVPSAGSSHSRKSSGRRGASPYRAVGESFTNRRWLVQAPAARIPPVESHAHALTL